MDILFGMIKYTVPAVIIDINNTVITDFINDDYFGPRNHKKSEIMDIKSDKRFFFYPNFE